jgi:hypothetical protein
MSTSRPGRFTTEETAPRLGPEAGLEAFEKKRSLTVVENRKRIRR